MPTMWTGLAGCRDRGLRRLVLVEFGMEFLCLLNDVFVELAFGEFGGDADGVFEGFGGAGSVGFDADTVDAEQEMAMMAKNGMSYDALAMLQSKNFRLLSEVMKS